MSMILRRELENDFMVLAETDQAATEQGARRPIVATRVRSRHGARIVYPAAIRNHRIPMPNLEEMQDAGLIKITRLDDQQIEVRVKADGHLHARTLRSQRNRKAGSP